MKEREPQRNIFGEIVRLSNLAIIALATACGSVEQINQHASFISGQGLVTAENNGFRLTASCGGEGHKLGSLELGPHIDLELTAPREQEQVWVYIKDPVSQKMVAVPLAPEGTTIIHGVVNAMMFGPGTKYQADAYRGKTGTEEPIARIEFLVKCP